MNKPRIGLSLRTVETKDYVEPRDAIAHDWYPFLKQLGCEWMLLPNIEGDIETYIKSFKIEAFILTGGNDIGESTKRDHTETLILDYASKKRLPVIGVCRGMQLLHTYFDGELSAIDDRSHIAKDHQVIFQKKLVAPFEKNYSLKVNSFHGQAIAAKSVAPIFEVTALSEDGWVEAFAHSKLPFSGIMWHPERFASPRKAELDLFHFFLLRGLA